MNKKYKTKEKSSNSHYIKKDLIIYIILRILVIAVLIRQTFNANWNNVFLCLLTLILFFIPSIIQKNFTITLPNTLENIILIFIFSAEILGEINNFYGLFKHWDTILHILNGFLCAAIGFSLVDLLNRVEKFHFALSPIFVALVAFCFSMTIGIIWEFFEFEMDNILKTDMQKDEVISSISSVYFDKNNKSPVVINNIKNTIIYSIDKKGNTLVTTINGGYLDIGINDTIYDLMVNFIGAFAFSLLGLLYIKDRDKYKIAEKFIPTIRNERKN